MPDLETRRALLELVERYPGLHVRELARQAKMSEALASYHLQHLVDADLVEAVEDRRFLRFYSRKTQVPAEENRDLMALLRRRVPLQVALVLLERGSASYQEITRELDLAKSTVSYHLATLQAAGLVRRAGPEDAFVLADPRRVMRLLLRWQPPKDTVSRFGELWSRFYARQRPRSPGKTQ